MRPESRSLTSMVCLWKAIDHGDSRPVATTSGESAPGVDDVDPVSDDPEPLLAEAVPDSAPPGSLGSPELESEEQALRTTARDMAAPVRSRPVRELAGVLMISPYRGARWHKTIRRPLKN